MTVRNINDTELEEWVAMRDRLWPGKDHGSDIIRYFQGDRLEPELVMVLLSESKIVMGHIELSVRVDPKGLRHGFIEGLYVKPEFRSGGAFRSLIRSALQWSKDQGLASVLADRGPKLYEIPHHGRPRLIEDGLPEEELHRLYPLKAQPSPAGGRPKGRA